MQSVRTPSQAGRDRKEDTVSEKWKPPRQVSLQTGLNPETQRGLDLPFAFLSSRRLYHWQHTGDSRPQFQGCVILAASDPSESRVSLALLFWQNCQVACHRVSLVTCIPSNKSRRRGERGPEGWTVLIGQAWVPCPLLDVQRCRPLWMI